MDPFTKQFVDIVNKLAPFVGILFASGLIVKYVPWLKWLSNQLIPIMNSLILFFGAFGGGTATASAAVAMAAGALGLFGVHPAFAQEAAPAVAPVTLSLFGKLLASFAISTGVHWVYESHLHPLLDKIEGALAKNGVVIRPGISETK